MFNWTEAAVSRLRHLWADGHSAPSIGRMLVEEFGGRLTRSAVIGKAHRLQLFRRTTTQRDKRQYERKQKPTQVSFNPSVVRKTKPLPFDDRKPRPVEVIPESQRVALLDLEAHHCRYPFGDGPITFCGRPRVLGIAYCVSHAHSCFQVPGKQLLENIDQSERFQKTKELEAVE